MTMIPLQADISYSGDLATIVAYVPWGDTVRAICLVRGELQLRSLYELRNVHTIFLDIESAIKDKE